jgi:hypothetical protein
VTPAEAAVLLGMAATVDNRKPDEDAAKAWAAMLDGLRFEDCRIAVIEHYKASTDWLMPAKVRSDVKKLRAKRQELHPPLTPPAHLDGDPAATNAWLKAARRRIGDGEQVDSAAEYGGELKPRDLSKLRMLPAPKETA